MSERAAGDPVNELSKKKNGRSGRRWQRLIAGPQFHSLQMCCFYISASVKFFFFTEKEKFPKSLPSVSVKPPPDLISALASKLSSSGCFGTGSAETRQPADGVVFFFCFFYK